MKRQAGGKIKPGEQVAIEYFQSKGYLNIVHEPDGNIPPDLLINNTIAIEVRRLNQFIVKKGSKFEEPVELLEYELMPRIRSLISQYDSKYSEMTSYVSVRYRRPMRVNKQLIQKIRNVLEYHLLHLGSNSHYQIDSNLILHLWPCTLKRSKPYVWASSFDEDSGGTVLSNMLESLKIIIEEKENKIIPYKAKYQTWWLATIDKIGYGIDDFDLYQIKQSFKIPTFFERIIFISPFDSSEGQELIFV